MRFQFLRRLLFILSPQVRIGQGTKIEWGAKLGRGSITLGQKCVIGFGAMLLPYGGFIKLGDGCTVNPYTILYGHGGLTIGNFVRIAAHTVIIPAQHTFSDLSRPIANQPLTKRGISIDDDTWIGCNVSILDGVHIGKGSVVGAGSVVNKDVPSNTIVAGVPAKVIGKRETSSTDSLKPIL